MANTYKEYLDKIEKMARSTGRLLAIIECLEIVQKLEPDATLGDVIIKLAEHLKRVSEEKAE